MSGTIWRLRFYALPYFTVTHNNKLCLVGEIMQCEHITHQNEYGVVTGKKHCSSKAVIKAQDGRQLCLSHLHGNEKKKLKAARTAQRMVDIKAARQEKNYKKAAFLCQGGTAAEWETRHNNRVHATSEGA
jgi:hypothetical protein